MGEAKRRKFELKVLQKQPSMQVVPKEAAEKYSWLGPLARAYATADLGIANELDRRAAAGNPGVACHRGCHACCMAPVLDVNQLEIRGLSWFLAEVLEEPRRSRVRDQVRNHEERLACPLLLDGECSVYPMRPITCRQFQVARTPCGPGEDVLKTRPEDIVPIRGALMHEAASIMLQELGGSSKQEADEAVRAGVFFEIARPLHRMALEQFANVMDAYDAFQEQQAKK